MEEELKKLKMTLEDEPDSSAYREQAVAIKTYCDLLLSSTSVGQSTPKVQHASVMDVKEKTSAKNQPPIYDEDDDYDGDSGNLLDF